MTKRGEFVAHMVAAADWVPRQELIRATGHEKGYAAILGPANGKGKPNSLKAEGLVDVKMQDGRVSYRLTAKGRQEYGRGLGPEQEVGSLEIASTPALKSLAAPGKDIPDPPPPVDLPEFDPQNLQEGKEYTDRSIAVRRGQPAFRRKLLGLYSSECCLSRCNIQELLEAAHIVPFNGHETDDPTNGLLLRTDLHTLFDLGWLRIDPSSLRVQVHPAVASDPLYKSLDGRQIKLVQGTRPSSKALQQHNVMHAEKWG